MRVHDFSDDFGELLQKHDPHAGVVALRIATAHREHAETPGFAERQDGTRADVVHVIGKQEFNQRLSIWW